MTVILNPGDPSALFSLQARRQVHIHINKKSEKIEKENERKKKDMSQHNTTQMSQEDTDGLVQHHPSFLPGNACPRACA